QLSSRSASLCHKLPPKTAPKRYFKELKEPVGFEPTNRSFADSGLNHLATKLNLKNDIIRDLEMIVIGGGHAGIEAALISARLGHRVALITLSKNKIGLMPCNPSVGGPAKGIVVREIDALGGEMGKAADATALQFKLLNTSNGLAVQALRVQSDKVAYAHYMQKVVSEQKNLTVVEGAVKNLLITKGKASGVELNNGEFFFAKIIILTTGTYLRPIIYQGQASKIEGPAGEKEVVNNISQQLKELGFRLNRFKTGTSPRILKDSIDYSQFKLEP
ncbi:18659_t:CDS:2, partial [Funneliformis geosporum]